jgi:hypothetical protein
MRSKCRVVNYHNVKNRGCFLLQLWHLHSFVLLFLFSDWINATLGSSFSESHLYHPYYFHCVFIEDAIYEMSSFSMLFTSLKNGITINFIHSNSNCTLCSLFCSTTNFDGAILV